MERRVRDGRRKRSPGLISNLGSGIVVSVPDLTGPVRNLDTRGGKSGRIYLDWARSTRRPARTRRASDSDQATHPALPDPALLRRHRLLRGGAPRLRVPL